MAWSRLCGAAIAFTLVTRSIQELVGVDTDPPDGPGTGCSMTPGWSVGVYFFIVSCTDDVHSMSLELEGKDLFTMDNHTQSNKHGIDLPHSEKGVLYKMQSCPTAAVTENCTTYTFDVYRAREYPLLDMLSVNSNSGMLLEPAFDPKTFDYKTSVPLDTPFTITAITTPHVYVGIEAKGPGRSGLDEKENGCDNVHEGRMVWSLLGAQATGEMTYTVCVVQSTGTMSRYNLVISREVIFNTNLKFIGVSDGYSLNMPFDQEQKEYEVLIPPKQMSLGVKITAVDPNASISILVDTNHTTDLGSTDLEVAMKDNSIFHLGEAEAPRWSQFVKVTVTSPDGENFSTYSLNVQQDVSNFADVANISVHLSPIKKNHNNNSWCALKPAFQPNITDYSCVFWWDPESQPSLVADFGEKCRRCSIARPDPQVDNDDTYYHHFEEDDSEFYASAQAFEDWREDQVPFKWKRTFKYGEKQTIPLIIRAEDRYTLKTYTVKLHRNCPWYMEKSFTDKVSQYAGMLAFFMAVTSAPNIVNLAKQIQFMTLLAGIPDAPESYVDFCSSLQSVNLNFGKLIDPPFLLDEEDFRRMKQELIDQIGQQMKILHIELLLEYCFAFRGSVVSASDARLIANTLFRRHCKSSVYLVHELSNESVADPECAPYYEEKYGPGRRLSNMSTIEMVEREDLDPFVLDGAGYLRGTVERLGRALWRRLAEYTDGSKIGDQAWMWKRYEWETMVKEAHRLHVQEDSFPLLDCGAKELQEGLTFLGYASSLMQCRNTIRSTSGAFLIQLFLFAVIGVGYWFFYQTNMKGRQARLRVLEPGPLCIALLDYGLISTTQRASRIFVKDPHFALFMWEPSRTSEKVFCGLVLIYPICFIVFAAWQLYQMTAGKKELTYSTTLKQWIDPKARDLLVPLPPPVPAFIPLLPTLTTRQVHHALPVLNQEGDPIDFNAEAKKAEIKEAEKLLRQEQADKQAKRREQEKRKLEGVIATLRETGKESDNQKALNLQKTVDFWEAYEDEKHIFEEKRKRTVEESAEIAEREEKPSRPAWMDKDTTLPRISEVILGMTSKKGRSDYEYLDREEAYAMMQYIHNFQRTERRLSKYGIMKIVPDKGYLKPAEPMKDKPADQSDRWLVGDDTVENERRLIDQYGYDLLREDGTKPNYIEDAEGKRLVYKGNENLGPVAYLISFLFRVPGPIDGTKVGGRVEWMTEPEEGWEEWMRASESDVKYADKWQWLLLDRPDQPWYGDDASEKSFRCCGCCCSIDKADIPFYNDIQATVLKGSNFLLHKLRKRVPQEVGAPERKEIRRWLWKELMNPMQLKMKLVYLADGHPHFHTNPSLPDIAKAPFPNLHGQHKEWTMMRLEDTYDMDAEPWWAECDPPEKTEVKVMFDADLFWRDLSGTHDQAAVQVIQDTDLVPKRGYFTSVFFTKFPKAKIGVKRFSLTKPDGFQADIAVTIMFRHVFPFMRYTSGFKCNVQAPVLETPTRTRYIIMIGKAKKGEEYTYVVERFVTFISILVLADTSYGGFGPASIFMMLQLATFLNQFRVSWFSYTDKTSGTSEKFFKVLFLQAVFVLLLRTCTVAIIVLSYHTFPPQLCALALIAITCYTMIHMNLGTMGKEVDRIIGLIRNNTKKVQLLTRKYSARFWAVLDGDNPFGWQIYAAPEDEGADSFSPDEVDMVIHELGIHVDGKLVIDELAPEDERREKEILKTIGLWTHKLEEDDDRIPTIADHPRFYKDIVPGLALDVSLDQLLLRKKIPDVMVALQCVNHSISPISSRQYDCFKTLFRPEEWNEEDNLNKERLARVLANWRWEVNDWISNDLGGVVSERTDTAAIQMHISELLEKQLLSKDSRDIFRVCVGSVRFPTGGTFQTNYKMKKGESLVGRLAQVCVYYSNEHITRSFHMERCSKFGVIEEDARDDDMFVVRINDSFIVERKPGLVKIKFALWIVTDDTHEELVAFTGDIDTAKKLYYQTDEALAIPERPFDIYAADEDDAVVLPRASTESTIGGIGRDSEDVANTLPEDPRISADHGLIKTSLKRKEAHKEGVKRVQLPPDRKGTLDSLTFLWQKEEEEKQKEVERLYYSQSDALMHTRWSIRGRSILRPFGGEDPDPKEEKARKEKEDEEAKMLLKMDWSERLWVRTKRALWDLVTFKRCTEEAAVDQKERDRSRGHIEFNLLPATVEDRVHDDHVMDAISQVLDGATKMSLDLFSRHKDRWLHFAEFLRIHIGANELEAPQKRLAELKGLLEKWQRVEEAAERGRHGNREKEFFEKAIKDSKLRRGMDSAESVREAVKELEQYIDVFKLSIDQDKELLTRARYSGPKDTVPSPIKKVGVRIMMDHSNLNLTTERLAQMSKQAGGLNDYELNFANKLMVLFTRLKDRRKLVKKQILHYVIVSDHLKPSRQWRPDTIPPHDAQIVSGASADIEFVIFESLERRVTFVRQLKHPTQEPKLINGRLSFKADLRSVENKPLPAGGISDIERALSMTINELFQKPEVYITWDGDGKWLVSNSENTFFQYRITSKIPEKYIWIKDPAQRPDQVSDKKKWRVRPDLEWLTTDHVRIISTANQLEEEEEEEDEKLDWEGDSTYKYVKGMALKFVQAVKDNLGAVNETSLPPELKSCMLSITANHVSFLWKDSLIERLRPFRVKLQQEYETFSKAWCKLTEEAKIPISLVEDNLCKLLEETLSAFRNEDSGKDTGMQLTMEDQVQARRAFNAAFEARASVNVQRLLIAPNDSTEVKREKRFLREYLETNVKDATNFRDLAHDIASMLDEDKSDYVTFAEVLVLYNDGYRHQTTKVADFQEWVRCHPEYCAHVAPLWAKLTEGHELKVGEFVRAVEKENLMSKLMWDKKANGAGSLAGAETADIGDLTKFSAADTERSETERLAYKIFQDLDSQMTGGITLKELEPTVEGSYSSEDGLLLFKVPLTQLWEIKPEAYKGKKTMCFRVNPKFANSREWSNLRLAIDPQWEPHPEKEVLRVRMDETYFKLWKSVIEVSGMDRPQEFVRFYAGACVAHPYLNGWYMRSGYGRQLWADTVYEGFWKNHVYSGRGELWPSVEAFTNRTGNPTYEGEWKRGRRHGKGIMRWQQETCDYRVRGLADAPTVSKVFEGEFDNDLFKSGFLYIAEVAKQQFTRDHQPDPGSVETYIPYPRLDASQMLSFDGEFRYTTVFMPATGENVDFWAKAHKASRAGDDSYLENSFPNGQNYMLHKVSVADKRMKKRAYTDFFSLDHEEVQLPGKPMADLALATYTPFRGEAPYFKKAREAKYIDGSVYSGDYEDGLPHGFGTLRQYAEQRDSLDARAAATGTEIASYEGDWSTGTRHGKGTYKTCDELIYVGQWSKDKRSGQGRQDIPPGLVNEYGYTFYEGEWRDDMRHGKCKQMGLVPTSGKQFVFEGNFANDVRTSRGKLYQERAGKLELVYHGFFENNGFMATYKQPCWMQCVDASGQEGSWYYGTLKDGLRDGRGTLFAKEAAADPDFKAHVENGRKYNDTLVDKEPKFKTYDGLWKKNVPHGPGTQYISGQGSYVGQFQDGKRHGTGTWESYDGAWTWKPCVRGEMKDSPNWANDEMHGVGIVVEKTTTHENVVFRNNQCEVDIPFTFRLPHTRVLSHGTHKVKHHGPPTSGLEYSLVIGLDKDKKGGGAGRGYTRSAGSDRGSSDGEEEEESLMLHREPTFVSSPVEDLVVFGGTDENEVMNGLYIKLKSSFGRPLWRSVRLNSIDEIVVTYVTLDRATGVPYWVITQKLEAGRKGGVGSAWVAAKGTGEISPAEVTAPWHVFVPQKNVHHAPLSDDQEQQAGLLGISVDRIKVFSVAGFDLTPDFGENGPREGLMLRHEKVNYGRPVYYSEYGHQYMYWVSTEKVDPTASEAAGKTSNSSEPPDVARQAGAWIISSSSRESEPTGPDALAYCTDPGSTPDNISADSKWYVRTRKVGEEGEFEVKKVQLRMKFTSVAEAYAPMTATTKGASAGTKMLGISGASSSGVQNAARGAASVAKVAAAGAASGATSVASGAASAAAGALSSVGYSDARTLQAARGSS